MTDYDVAIVGAGPAGSSLAIQLAEDGLNVLLIEKQTFPRDKTCGDLVSAKGLTLLDSLGCLEPIHKQDYVPLRAARTALNGQWLSRGDIPTRADMVDHAHAVPRIVLDEVMFRRAQQAGARTVEACKVKEVTIERDRVCVRAEQANKCLKFSARLLVGADGPHSVVARQVGLEMTDPRYVDFALRAYCNGLPIREAVILFEEDFFPGFGWVFPVSDGRANVGVGMFAESMKKFDLDLKRFFDRLKERLKCWAVEEGWHIEVEEPTGWPIKTYGGARRNFFERGLLIGEAGCFVDPINGEGIPLAMESAKLAAKTIKKAFDLGEFGHEILSQYERDWRSTFDPNLRISDLVTSTIRNRHLSKLWIEGLKLVCRTAESDLDYARKMGGILAGTVPIREGLAPDVLLKPLIEAIRSQTNLLHPAAPNLFLLPQLLGRAIEFGLWEVSTIAQLAGDSDWVASWYREVAHKQKLVMADLRA